MKLRTLLGFLFVAITLISCKTSGDTDAKTAADAKHHYAVPMTGVV